MSTLRLPALLSAVAALAALTLSAGQVHAQTAEASARKQKAELQTLMKAGQAAFQAQDWKTSVEKFGAVVAVDDTVGLAWHHLGFAHHALGQLDEALVAHEKGAGFPQFAGVCSYNAACVHALRGNADQAFEWLDKAIEGGFRDRGHITTDADMASLRDDARFAKLMDRLEAMPPKVQVYAGTSARQQSRLSFWNQSGSPGQMVLDWGSVAWKDSYASAIESGQYDGVRWRLGSDFWTTLDTNLDLTIGGVELPRGLYYLTLEKSAEGKFQVAFLDPAKIREKRLDAYLAQYTTGGTMVELTHRDLEEPAPELTLSITPKDGDVTKAKLVIAFGPHELTAPVSIEF